jgi:hypothetical protein
LALPEGLPRADFARFSHAAVLRNAAAVERSVSLTSKSNASDDNSPSGLGEAAPHLVHPAVDGPHSIENPRDKMARFLLTLRIEGVKP